jgi:hypothetical protein
MLGPGGTSWRLAHEPLEMSAARTVANATMLRRDLIILPTDLARSIVLVLYGM